MRVTEFADFLDFLAMGLASGLVLDQACFYAIRALPEGDFKKQLEELPSHRLFSDLLGTVRHPRLSGILAIINQAQMNGAPLSEMLTQQAHFLREEHLAELEKKAQTLGLRLLWPILLFIFPSLFILLLGSLYLQIASQGFFL